MPGRNNRGKRKLETCFLYPPSPPLSMLADRTVLRSRPIFFGGVPLFGLQHWKWGYEGGSQLETHVRTWWFLFFGFPIIPPRDGPPFTTLLCAARRSNDGSIHYNATYSFEAWIAMAFVVILVHCSVSIRGNTWSTASCLTRWWAHHSYLFIVLFQYEATSGQQLIAKRVLSTPLTLESNGGCNCSMRPLANPPKPKAKWNPGIVKRWLRR